MRTMAAASFGLMLQETTRVSGATDDEDDSTMAIVNLNSSGSGEIVYEVIGDEDANDMTMSLTTDDDAQR